jgi:hypothetical protein
MLIWQLLPAGPAAVVHVSISGQQTEAGAGSISRSASTSKSLQPARCCPGCPCSWPPPSPRRPTTDSRACPSGEWCFSAAWSCAPSTLQRQFRPNFHIHVSLSDLYIPRISLHISSSRTGRPIVGLYNSLTDTWLWKLGLRPRYFFSGNICYKFSAFCLCSAASYVLPPA